MRAINTSLYRSLLGMSFLGISLLAVACGGKATPEPKTPEAATEPAETAKKEEAAKPEAKEAPAEEEKIPDSDKKTPLQVLTSDNVSFVFSFPDSDIKAVRAEECAKKAKDDDAKKAACMTKASETEVESTGIRFEKSGEDWVYYGFSMPKGKVIDLHRFQVKFDGETKDSIKVVPQGKDTGKKPGAVPKEFTITVPDMYSIVIEDPKKGKMVYRSKVGLLAKPGENKPAGAR